MNRAAGAAVLACALAAGARAGAEEPWETIWFRVPMDADGAVSTSTLLEVAHGICQALGARHYRSGSSRLGPVVHNPQAEHDLDRVVVAACTAEKERVEKR